MEQVKGFTLLELIVTLAVVAILAGLGIPAMGQWLENAKARSLQYALIHSIQYSRKQAVHLRLPITLCPGIENCETKWTENILIFNDSNANRSLDADERLLRSIKIGAPGKYLDYNRKNPFIRFTSIGRAGNAGSLKYCRTETGENNFRIVIAPVGRVRIADESNC